MVIVKQTVRTRKQRVWLVAICCVLGCVLGARVSRAQSGSTSSSGGGITSPDTTDNYFSTTPGGSAAGPSTIIETFQQATSGWISNIVPIANSLFWALAGIDFIWTCITLVLHHDDLKTWMAGFVKKLLSIGFFAALLTNGQTWIADIVNFFISAGGTAGGTQISSINASSIMGVGISIAGTMITGGPNAPGVASRVVSLFVNPQGNIATALVMVIGAFIIVLSFVMIALHFVMAMAEAYITISAGYIFLGFGGSRWTTPYLEKYLGMVVSAGVRIMVLEMIIGLGNTMASEWSQMATTICTTPSMLSVTGIIAGGTTSSTWSGIQLEFALISSIAIFAMCCWTVPKIAANVASGSLSMSGSDLTGSAVGGAAAAGAMAGAVMGSPKSPGTASEDKVGSIAQAAAMRGASMGAQLAMAAATGGASAGVSAASAAVSAGVTGAVGAAGGAGVAAPTAASVASSASSAAGSSGGAITPQAPSVGGIGSDASSSSSAGDASTASGGGGDPSRSQSSSGSEPSDSGEQSTGTGTTNGSGISSLTSSASAGDQAAFTEANATDAGLTAPTPSESAGGQGTGTSESTTSQAAPSASTVQSLNRAMEQRDNAQAEGADISQQVSKFTQGLKQAHDSIPDGTHQMGGSAPKVGHGE